MREFKWLTKRWLESLPADTLIETTDGRVWLHSPSGKWKRLTPKGGLYTSQDVALKHYVGRIVGDPTLTQEAGES